MKICQKAKTIVPEAGLIGAEAVVYTTDSVVDTQSAVMNLNVTGR
jgi:hypothetical protein